MKDQQDLGSEGHLFNNGSYLFCHSKKGGERSLYCTSDAHVYTADQSNQILRLS